ncbi:MAG: hypothetical protein AAGG00_18350 [Cyanobacteria bacterium P01_H01_bin.150]
MWWAISYPLAGWLGSQFPESEFLYASFLGFAFLAVLKLTLSPPVDGNENNSETFGTKTYTSRKMKQIKRILIALATLPIATFSVVSPTLADELKPGEFRGIISHGRIRIDNLSPKCHIEFLGPTTGTHIGLYTGVKDGVIQPSVLDRFIGTGLPTFTSTGHPQVTKPNPTTALTVIPAATTPKPNQAGVLVGGEPTTRYLTMLFNWNTGNTAFGSNAQGAELKTWFNVVCHNKQKTTRTAFYMKFTGHGENLCENMTVGVHMYDNDAWKPAGDQTVGAQTLPGCASDLGTLRLQIDGGLVSENYTAPSNSFFNVSNAEWLISLLF